MLDEQNNSRIKHLISVWTERADEASKHGHTDVASAARAVSQRYEQLLNAANKVAESETLVQANVLRKKIESCEQHRTMCVEHGLNDAAIDATYEIEELEKQLVKLVE